MSASKDWNKAQARERSARRRWEEAQERCSRYEAEWKAAAQRANEIYQRVIAEEFVSDFSKLSDREKLLREIRDMKLAWGWGERKQADAKKDSEEAVAQNENEGG